MNPSYNEREVLELLQDESTQKRGFELIVAQYRTIILADPSYGAFA